MKAALCLILIFIMRGEVSPLASNLRFSAHPPLAVEETRTSEAAPDTETALEIPPGLPQFAAPPLADADAASLNEILSSEDFGTEKPDWEIRFKNEPDFDPDGVNFKWRDFKFPRFKEIAGIAVRAIMIAAAALVFALLARYLYKRRVFSGAGKSGVRAYSTAGRADDPGELLARAEALHRENKIREAWALCFRAFLAAFGRCRGTAVPPDTTEYEALALAGEEGGSAFRAFVAQWVNFAYGGRSPVSGAFETALSSCRLLAEAPKIPAKAALRGAV